jgi:PTS system ascorbate-specific IIA component
LIPRVSVLVIAHEPLASALAACAVHVYACAPEALSVLQTIDVKPDADVATELKKAEERVGALDRGRGVLVLTDMFGATPANVAQQLARPGLCEVVTGVNLPMLLKSLCYCDQMSLRDLADKAIHGGSASVMRLASAAPQNQRVPREVPEKQDHAQSRLHDQQ